MPRLEWDKTGERFYETGIQDCALYVQQEGVYPLGVAWNGITKVDENPSGAEVTAIYADNIKYLNLVSTEELGLNIGAYTYPDEFAQCDGSAELSDGVTIGQQARKAFGLCYKTNIGNDTDGQDHGFKLHLVYGCTASPSSKSYSTINESPEAMELSWDVSTVPVAVPGHKPTSMVVIDSTKVDKDKLNSFLEIVYGKNGEGSTTARLPLPEEIISHFAA